MILEIIISILFVALILLNMAVAMILVATDTYCENPSLKNTISNSLKYSKELYIDRNLFGIILTTIVVLISIPGFILALVLSIFFEFCNLLVFIWKLGNKKES